MKTANLNKSSHRGFALIDVLIATMVLSIGAIAFVKLSNVSINRSKETDFRAQASQSANTLVEFIRSNYMLAPYMSEKKNGIVLVASEADLAGYDKQCANKEPSDLNSWCEVSSEKLYADVYHELERAFSDNYQNATGRAVMCLNGKDASGEDLSSTNNKRPYDIRVTVVWKLATSGQNGPEFVAAAKGDCPSTYTELVPESKNTDTVNTSVKDRGFFELYTRI